jgi:large subunit ribosomal protein L5
MEAATTDAPPARLKARYFEEIRPSLIGRFEYSSVMQAPRVEKITLNMGVGLAKQDSKVLKAATEQLATIAGQQPSVRRARKSIAAFKLREGMPVGVAVTLRGERAYEFLDRLVSVAIPRIRDFRGLNPRSFDGRGNYSMGVREQIIFPEIDYDAIDQVRGLDITISTSAPTDLEAFALLQALGMPFAAQGRPKGFDPQADEAEAEARAAAHAAKLAEAPAAPAKAAPEEPEEPAETAEADASAEPEASDEPAADDATAEPAEPEPQAKADTSEAEVPEDPEPGDGPKAAGEDTADAKTSTPEPDQAAEAAEKESTD